MQLKAYVGSAFGHIKHGEAMKNNGGRRVESLKQDQTVFPSFKKYYKTTWSDRWGGCI